MSTNDWRQRFADTAELLPVIICETDKSLRVTYVNRMGFEATGYTDEDFRAGVLLPSVIPTDQRERAGGTLHRILKGEVPGPGEYRVRNKDGSECDYQMNSAPIFDDGEVIGVRTTLIDVSERNRVKRELERSEEKFRRIFYQSPAAVALFDEEGAPQEVNSAFRGIFPDVLEEGVTLSLYDVVQIPEAGREVLKKGGVLKGETGALVEREGEKKQRIYDWSLTPLGEMHPGKGLLLQMLDVTREREEHRRAQALIDSLQEEVTGRYSFHNLHSRSAAMKNIFRMLGPVADAITTVLINGESGTGKEMIARAIHAQGPRRNKPFVAVNCSALPDNLLESELFGYKAGAFTDAKKDKPGKFAMANGGVIFLDEIGEIPGPMQAKLLRVLQERTFEPLGGTKTEKVDVRVLAATNRDLKAMVAAGTFREDLFYRLNVVPVTLPPLRERRGDIPVLCEQFVEKFNGQLGKSVIGLSRDAMGLLMNYGFPGNIRELENALEYAFVFCDGDTIERHHLPQELTGAVRLDTDSAPLIAFNSLDELEAAFLKAIIEDCGGSKLDAAERLGIHKTTLFRKLKKYNL